MTPFKGEPIRVSGFNGLFLRGQGDTCPPDHLQVCNNCVFPGPNQIQSREGLDTLQILPNNAVSFFPYVIRTALTQVSGFLYLNNLGQLFDSTSGALLISWGAGVDDFAAINLFGRVYISPKHIGRATIGANNVFYWDGTNFLPAAGVPPGAVAPTLSTTAVGNVDIGTHKVFVSFLYQTGFISGPSLGAVIVSTGITNIHISNIPIGGPGVVGRVLLITRANEEEMFFIPEGTINDNVTTTFDYNGFDTALVQSADYLNDILSIIPAVAAFKFYKGRLVYIGRNFDPDTTMFSRIDDPETIDTVNGVLTVPTDFYVSGTNTGLVIRDVLYLQKPNATYGTQDNGGEPATWPVSIVDSGIGAFDTGVTVFASALSAQDVNDSSLVVNQRGIILFTGVYEQNLTWKIDSLWQSIDPTKFYLLQIAHDVWAKRIYVSLPLAGATQCNFLLMGDYSDGGLNEKSIKWSLWNFPTFITKIGMSLISPNFTAGINYKFTMAWGGLVLQTLNPLFKTDLFNGNQITNILSTFRTALIAKSSGDMSVYTLLRLRINGAGKVKLTLTGQDLTVAQPIQGFNLSAYTQGQDLDRLINFTNEKMAVQLNTDPAAVAGSWFNVQRIDIFGAPQWKMRPALTESA